LERNVEAWAAVEADPAVVKVATVAEVNRQHRLDDVFENLCRFYEK
jgi:hypothetical protein